MTVMVHTSLWSACSSYLLRPLLSLTVGTEVEVTLFFCWCTTGLDPTPAACRCHSHSHSHLRSAQMHVYGTQKEAWVPREAQVDMGWTYKSIQKCPWPPGDLNLWPPLPKWCIDLDFLHFLFLGEWEGEIWLVMTAILECVNGQWS